LIYPLVCPATYRRVVFDTEVDRVLKELCLESAPRDELVFLEIGPDQNHVHCLVQAVPSDSATKIVKIVKSLTARALFKRVPSVKKQLWGGAFGSTGYFLSTVGRHGSEEMIRRAVNNPGTDKDYKQLHSQAVQRELL
jgi:REP-associated tyrosine transposase